ncbi:MAG: hypothetical protein KTR16_11465 [Acidiferrobacterales bacterium]|nr:hypothetical protein [Acidiferrobacterales bacterium]
MAVNSNRALREHDKEALNLYCIKYFGDGFYDIDASTARIIEKLYLMDALNLKGLFDGEQE